MIEFTDEELRTARLWRGFVWCLTELKKQGADIRFDFQTCKGLNEFAFSHLGKRIIALDGEHLGRADFERLIGEPVREALGIEKL